MVFQVIKDGKVKFWTNMENCIPNEEQIKALKKAGYKVKWRKEKANGNACGKRVR